MEDKDLLKNITMKAEKNILGCDIVNISVGTNGYHNDPAKTTESYVKITEKGSLLKGFVNFDKEKDTTEIQINIHGEGELLSIIEAFRFAANTLQSMAETNME